MKPPRILIMTPSALPAVTGNAMTVERWRRGLMARGGEVLVLETRHPDLTELAAATAAFRPDIVHAHHLFLSGGLLSTPPLADILAGVPAVATPAGTDLNQEDLRARGKLDTLGRICGRIGEMVIQNRYFHRLVAALLPEAGFRVSYVPKSFCWLGDAPCRLRERAGIGGDEFVFFLPAGIRPVKGNLAGLRVLADAHRHFFLDVPHDRVLTFNPVFVYVVPFLRQANDSRCLSRSCRNVDRDLLTLNHLPQEIRDYYRNNPKCPGGSSASSPGRSSTAPCSASIKTR